MYDEKIITIREKVSAGIALAENSFESADLLYESEKYRASIPLFIDSVLSGVKALLMLSLDDLPDDSLLVDSYYQSEISKQIKLDIGLNEVLTKLRKVEQDSIDHPLKISKESIKDLDICNGQIEKFLTKASRLIKNSLVTKKEIKKKKFVRKLIIATSAGTAAIFVSANIILSILSLGYGLTGEYFADQNFEELIKIRKDKKIDFDWNIENIINNYSDNVYIRWDGKIKAPRNGEYEFITVNDDGVRVWIDDNLIIDDWKPHASEERIAKINLEKGYHRIKVEYFEGIGFARMTLGWIIPGKKKQKVISPSYLRPVKRLIIDSSQEESNRLVGEIIGGIEIGQTFYCHNKNLAQIEVMLATYRRENHQDVTFHLKKSPNDKKDIYTEKFNASNVVDNAFRSFDFPPISNSKGKMFYFSFESPQSKYGDAITIWASRGNKYKKGTLCINRKRSKGDLKFITYCYTD